MRSLRSALAVSLLLAGCGGDNTSPSGNVNVSGTWLLSLSNFSGGGLSCSGSGVQLGLSQSSTVFTGTHVGGTLTCLANGQTVSGQLAQGTILNGTVAGSTINFDVDTPDSHFTGTVTGNSMSGTGTDKEDFGAPVGVIVLTGSWGATKQ